MSLSPLTVAAIQLAGEKLFASRVAVEEDLAGYGQGFLELTREQPFSIEAARSFERYRTLSQLSQELAALEENLRSIFTKAAAFQTDVKPSSPRSIAYDTSNAVDTIARPALSFAQSVPKPKRQRKSKKARGDNDALVSQYLEDALKGTMPTKITHQQISSGANVPSGSVSAIVKRLVKKGVIVASAEGYRLAD